MIWKFFLAVNLFFVISQASNHFTRRPGKCPKITVLTHDCVLCKHDVDCPSPERCCGGCCTANLLNVACKDKKGKVVGDCVYPEFCKLPNVESDKFKCEQPWRKRGCICCVPPPSIPKPRRGKCPHKTANSCDRWCSFDQQCPGQQKCCNHCCRDPIACRSKSGRWGLCQHKGTCKKPFEIIGKCKKRPKEKRCDCCAEPQPKTTKPPPRRCLATWAGRTWAGICIPKNECKKPNPYNFRCKAASSQCPKNFVCCFTQSTKPNVNACRT